jgi:hypothetical protein
MTVTDPLPAALADRYRRVALNWFAELKERSRAAVSNTK